MTDRIDFIQALRGIAALWVLWYHALPFITAPVKSDVAQILFAHGDAGVDLFFVISGFIMIYTTRHIDGSAGSALAFWLKRWWRLWPMYMLATVIYVMAIIHRLFQGFPDGTTKGLLQSMVFYPLPEKPIYAIGWTLNLEMYFYSVFALALLFGRWRWLTLATWSAMSFLLALSPGMMTQWAHAAGPLLGAYVRQAGDPCIGSFVYGMLVAWFYTSPLHIPTNYARAATAVSAALLVGQCTTGVGAKLGFAGYGATSAALMVSLVALEKSGSGWRPSPLLVWLGKISFSLYLVHAITNPLLTDGLRAIGFGQFVTGLSYLPAVTVAGVLAATALYAVFEDGLFSRWRKWVERKFASTQTTNAMLAD